MTPQDAAAFIGQHFNRMSFDPAQNEAKPEALFVEVLDAIEAHIPFPTRRQNEHLRRFLWAGCRRFNRWFVPSPYVVPETFEIIHARFVVALRNLEGDQPENAPVFEIHSLRDRLYRLLNQKGLPLDTSDLAIVQALSIELHAIMTPSFQVKLIEFEKEKAVLLELLRALQGGDIVSHFRLSLPYPLVRAPVPFSMTWQGLKVRGQVISHFAKPSELMVSASPPITIVSERATRWQFGATDLALQIKCSGRPKRTGRTVATSDGTPAGNWVAQRLSDGI